jgi:23S rRNA (pseudouridine1915-N3)-methyltransferase
MAMRYRILWIGKTRERYIREGIERYLGLIRPFARVETVEIREEKGKDRARALRRETERIFNLTESYLLLTEQGREMSSEDFSEYIRKRPRENFLIGGPYGVSDEVLEGASDRISLSKMTFTHEMARLIFLEQLYRAITIIKGKRYHH